MHAAPPHRRPPRRAGLLTAAVLTALQVLACGLLLLSTSLLAPVLQRLPLSTSIIYLAAGAAVGPWGLGWLRIDPLADAALIERMAEVAVLVSLFVTGLKMDARPARRPWRAAVRLASVTMVLSIALMALAAHAVLGLPWAAALLLGAVLAPTDPVLAAEIQVRSTEDRDALRFSLTGEAGLNDGTAFPFVMLGLGLLGHHELGPGGTTWLLYDGLWAVGSGLAVGWAVGRGVGAAAVRFKGWRPDSEPLSEFIAVGAIAASYGAALAVGGYGFLAVFLTGIGLRRAFAGHAGGEEDVERSMHSVLRFNGQLERIVEFVLVIVVGAALASVAWAWPLAGFAALALLVVRPLAVGLSLRTPMVTPRQRRLTGWFGIRGIGSLYYLAYALQHGLPADPGAAMASAVLVVVAVSIVAHGLSVTPLMAQYERLEQRARRARGARGQRP